MSSTGSVSQWIGQLQAGDEEAVRPLWERYFHRLVALARTKLGGLPRRAANEEDVALSAFDSFCRAAGNGRFPHLLDRDGLWRLLVVITARKAFAMRRHERRQKRGGPNGTAEIGAEPPDLEQLLSKEPTPEFAAQLAEESQQMLHRLDEPELTSIALWKMEGYTNEEIAAKLGYGLRSVERKLRLIRTIWAREAPP
jgi:DNA-directed RNA polymerase specialized sigma24 family protein